MAGTTSSIISNLLSSLERLSQFIPTFSLLAASSSSSIAHVTPAKVNLDQERLIEDLSRLSRMLQRIQAVLHYDEEREINEKFIQQWLNELREVAYDAEDVLDQYDYKVIKTQLEGMTAVAAEPFLKGKQVDDDEEEDDIYGYQVSLPLSNSIKIPISCDMATKIIEIIKKFDEIAHDRKALYLSEDDALLRYRFNDVMRRPPSSSLVLESDSEKENIVPIAGMGGAGKTTLSQLVCNDPKESSINRFLHVLSKDFDSSSFNEESIFNIYFHVRSEEFYNNNFNEESSINGFLHVFSKDYDDIISYNDFDPEPAIAIAKLYFGRDLPISEVLLLSYK